MCQLVPRTRRAIAIPWSALVANKAHEFWIKGTGRRIKGQGMIGADASRVREGFEALAREGHFDEYNLPQAWVESRTIPKALHGRVPAKGARILDLGCGPGHSTRIIAHCADPSWSIHGLDLIPANIERAIARGRASEYRDQEGRAIRPTFFAQDIGQPLRDATGELIADRSVHMALAGGVVGLYMDPPSASRLARELARVVVPSGYAAIDAGPALPEDALRTLMREAGFLYEATIKSFVIDPRPKLVFRVRG